MHLVQQQHTIQADCWNTAPNLKTQLCVWILCPSCVSNCWFGALHLLSLSAQHHLPCSLPEQGTSHQTATIASGSTPFQQCLFLGRRAMLRHEVQSFSYVSFDICISLDLCYRQRCWKHLYKVHPCKYKHFITLISQHQDWEFGNLFRKKGASESWQKLGEDLNSYCMFLWPI